MLKAIRLHMTRAMCGQPLMTSAHPQVGINKMGLPRMAGPLHQLLHGDVWDKRFMLTLLTASRLLTVKAEPNLSTITDFPTHNGIKPLCEEAKVIAGKLSKTLQIEWTKPHISTKAGPQGQAIDASIHDLFA